MYAVAVKKELIAQHYLIGGDWGAENEPHSHRYEIEVKIESGELDQHGYLVDIVQIEDELQGIVAYFSDNMLNDKPEFEGLNPSIEHFSRIVCEKLLSAIQPPGSGKFSVKIWENDFCWAAYVKDYS
ncbi:MAG: 6-carboxytetrahydropterin synthase [Gammaproteobacteria bacterium]|nr:6-carboxytetrahydropterin synthase [Gammaproteobacteria bacterium]